MTASKPKKDEMRGILKGYERLSDNERLDELERKLEALKKHLVGSMRWEDVGG